MPKTSEQLKKEWVKRVSTHLLGRKITKVEYLSAKECKDLGWDNCPIAIQLDNNVWLTPMSDDEGNDGGVISTNINKLSVIPTI